MSWFKLDDTFGNHPKVTRAGNAPTGLWVRSGTYSAQYLLDGHIPIEVARDWGKPSEIQSLLDTGLWVENGSGFIMPDYLEFNPSREDTLAKREAERQRKAGQR